MPAPPRLRCEDNRKPHRFVAERTVCACGVLRKGRGDAAAMPRYRRTAGRQCRCRHRAALHRQRGDATARRPVYASPCPAAAAAGPTHVSDAAVAPADVAGRRKHRRCDGPALVRYLRRGGATGELERTHAQQAARVQRCSPAARGRRDHWRGGPAARRDPARLPHLVRLVQAAGGVRLPPVGPAVQVDAAPRRARAPAPRRAGGGAARDRRRPETRRCVRAPPWPPFRRVSLVGIAPITLHSTCCSQHFCCGRCRACFRVCGYSGHRGVPRCAGHGGHPRAAWLSVACRCGRRRGRRRGWSGAIAGGRIGRGQASAGLGGCGKARWLHADASILLGLAALFPIFVAVFSFRLYLGSWDAGAVPSLRANGFAFDFSGSNVILSYGGGCGLAR